MAINLYYSDDTLRAQALELAAVVPDAQVLLADSTVDMGELYLLLTNESLVVVSPLFKPFNVYSFYHEFIAKRKPGLKREILLQAINLKPSISEPIRVIDLTAGLGRDSILMALSGFMVTMLENNPYLAIILNYLCLNFRTQLSDIHVIYTHNYDYLQNITDKHGVIYFDPMFADGKNALAKKDMQLIDLMIKTANQISHIADDAIFNLAWSLCSHKLVVKRDNKQQCLIEKPRPTYNKTGKTIRFDVYQIPSQNTSE